MRTIVISDLHLGALGRLPRADGALCEMLREEPCDQLIIAGDLFDLWTASFAEIVKEHKAVLSAIEALPVVLYLPGNHDPLHGLTSLNNMKIVKAPLVYTDGGKTVAVAHGDKYEQISYSTSRIADFIVSLADRVAQFFAGPGVSVRRTLRRSFASIGPAREKYALPIAQAAVEDLGASADVVLVGHTHLPEVREFEGTLYINTGDIGPEHLSYVVVEDGAPTLRYLT